MIFDFSSRGTISKNGKAPILESPIEDGIISFVYGSHLKKTKQNKKTSKDGYYTMPITQQID